MKFKLFVLALLVAMIATPALAQYGSDSSAPAQDPAAQSQDQGMQSDPAATSTSTGSMEPSAADSSANAPADAAANLVEATVSSIDQEKGELKVNDLTGAERTYQVSDTNSLQDIKEGDQVKITPDPSDPTKAQMVEKSEQNANQGSAF